MLILFGFMMAFYIQLHQDFVTKYNDQSVFTEYSTVPLKGLAMFVGELEYGDFPFEEYFWNHLTFILFVYFVVLVMMNLLTGVALMDVQKLTNDSGTVPRNGQNRKKIAQARHHIFLRVSKNGKMKMFHSYPKE